MDYSESFYITVAGIGVSALGLFLWYFKTTLISSRCEEVICCFGLLNLKNKVLSDDALQNIVVQEQPPAIPVMSKNGEISNSGVVQRSNYATDSGAR